MNTYINTINAINDNYNNLDFQELNIDFNIDLYNNQIKKIIMNIYEIRFNNNPSIFEVCEGQKELKKSLKRIKTNSFKEYLKNNFNVSLKSIQVSKQGYVKTAISVTSHNDLYNN